MELEFQFIVTTMRFDMPHLKLLKGQHVYVRSEDHNPSEVRIRLYGRTMKDPVITIYSRGEFYSINLYQINF